MNNEATGPRPPAGPSSPPPPKPKAQFLRRVERPALLVFAGVALSLGVVLGSIGPMFVLDSGAYLAIFTVVGFVVLLAGQLSAPKRRTR
jgi:hypothetical protein